MSWRVLYWPIDSLDLWSVGEIFIPIPNGCIGLWLKVFDFRLMRSPLSVFCVSLTWGISFTPSKSGWAHRCGCELETDYFSSTST